MATNQYIGARYVPLFAEPYQWDKTKEYEPLTIVYDKGNSYTSRQYVPAGIDILDDKFWALTGNYNAQVEQYRSEVKAYNDRITTAQSTADTAKATADNALSLGKTNETDIAANDAELAGTAPSGLKTMIDKNASDIAVEVTRATGAESTITNNVTALDTKVDAKFPVVTGDVKDAAITAAKIADGSVTTTKLADGSVANAKLAAGIDGAKISDTSIPRSKLAFRTVPNYKILFCGDSYSADSYGDKSVANQLKKLLPQCDIVNVAVGGAGYNVDTRTFLAQLRDAATNYDAKSFDVVIIAGGRNDVSPITTYAANTFDYAITTYTNARIIVVPMLWDFSPISFNDRVIASDISIQAQIRGCDVLNHAWTWGKGEPDWYDTDQKHPLPTGAKVMAGYIADGIKGCYSGRYYAFSTTWGKARFIATLSQDIVSISISGDTSGSSSSGFPKEFWPYFSVPVYGYVNGGDNPKLFFFSKDGVEIFSAPSNPGSIGVHAIYHV